MGLPQKWKPRDQRPGSGALGDGPRVDPGGLQKVLVNKAMWCDVAVRARGAAPAGASRGSLGAGSRPAVRLRERRVCGEFWAGGLRGGRWGRSGPGGGPGTQWVLLLPRF